MSEAKEFLTRGPIDPDKQIYIERPEDKEILQAMHHRDYVTLFGARQTGKTSLLYKLAGELRTEIPVFVDLSGFSYDSVARTIVRRLPQELKGAIGDVSSCANHGEFYNLLVDIAYASSGPRMLVFLLDEMERVPEESRDDFFGTIRKIFIERNTEEVLQKYRFVLAGATPSSELITSEQYSPFNISKTIYMSDFSSEGVSNLGENLRLHGFTIDNSVIEHIYDWTHGHPNLTQEMFTRLVQAMPGEVTEEMVDHSVEKLIVERAHNLGHILKRTKDKAVNQQVLDILNGKERPFSLSDPEVLNLYLIGVIKGTEEKGTKGKCVIRNKVYEKVLRSISLPPTISLPPISELEISILELLLNRKEALAPGEIVLGLRELQELRETEKAIKHLSDRGYIKRIENTETKYELTDKGRKLIQEHH